MNKYICYYAYVGQETEGEVRLLEPQVFLANNKPEALYKYHCLNAFYDEKEPFHKNLSEHMKSEYKQGGWGYFVLQLHDDSYSPERKWFEAKYKDGGYDK